MRKTTRIRQYFGNVNFPKSGKTNYRHAKNSRGNDHCFSGHKSEEYRRMLGQFGVSGDLALQQIESLSGGQKSRVAFAILCGHQVGGVTTFKFSPVCLGLKISFGLPEGQNHEPSCQGNTFLFRSFLVRAV